MPHPNQPPNTTQQKPGILRGIADAWSAGLHKADGGKRAEVAQSLFEKIEDLGAGVYRFHAEQVGTSSISTFGETLVMFRQSRPDLRLVAISPESFARPIEQSILGSKVSFPKTFLVIFEDHPR